jgi:hypothetical protein
VEAQGTIPPGVYGHSAALVDDNLMVVFGGYDNEIGMTALRLRVHLSVFLFILFYLFPICDVVIFISCLYYPSFTCII